MLQPKKSKFKKQFRGKMRGNASRGSSLDFGQYGLKSLGRGWLTDRQIEAARKAVSHYTKRAGKVWVRVFPHKPITKKPSGVRMGGGKGDIEGFVAPIVPGKIIFEIAGVSEEIAHQALKRAGAKLPFKTKVVSQMEF
ncbi:50S ribosomal protein L16 [Candidatus Woesebacteria bacterium CG_4_10_14_0_2_um_filter_39_14]|uniref:Large ribosomal subunit protein uL16 n=3 Tax=Microgenomates group TaxID=1794810 RepID=A0A2M6YPR1_9BACT|nr:MAG: 50S ribosomal protein L16 [Candidatus Shapirobacteria bacterium CG07_land_8_20_14_0_80_39_12]PIZ49100.1 MAG: 50S ribosomal protein L16 [Candidatus Woesebacteria bacterium CG_4_10_14_0_2_um_filter_39_14]PJA49261.1 MAG: 50S ribosomal protein L16 [Candidatus Shapirobacteria bacterium CG_4_9_14_3_um_filter_39_13]